MACVINHSMLITLEAKTVNSTIQPAVSEQPLKVETKHRGSLSVAVSVEVEETCNTIEDVIGSDSQSLLFY